MVAEAEIFAVDEAEEETDPEALAIAKMPLRERVSQIFTQVHRSAAELSETYVRETKR